MNRILRSLRLALALLLATLPLSACVSSGYHRAHVAGWGTYPYYGWYDGYYGPIYDGYWGSDNDFYYRLNRNDRVYHSDDQKHFRHDADRPGGDFHRFEGMTRQPPQGTRMPNFDRQQEDRSRDHTEDSDRDHR